MSILYDIANGRAGLLEVRNIAAQPAQTCLCVGNNRSKRLIHFMRDRRAHLSERADARNVGELGLSHLQGFLRLPGCGDIHHSADQLRLACFGDLAMRSYVKMFHRSVRH